MRKVINVVGSILVFFVLSMAIDTVMFSSIMFILEFFGEEIGLAISLNVLCLAITSCFVQVWLFFYFLVDINILKMKDIRKIKQTGTGDKK